jgi:hypothetical protein
MGEALCCFGALMVVDDILVIVVYLLFCSSSLLGLNVVSVLRE